MTPREYAKANRHIGEAWEDGIQMTDQEINEAIAAACGWTLRPYGDMIYWYNPQGHCCPIDAGHRNQVLLNYCADLNAIVPVVAKLTGASVGVFEEYLGEITGTNALALRRSFVGERFKLSIATARQYCEAFLRTIGKWKETA